jgi:hypothetical protein
LPWDFPDESLDDYADARQFVTLHPHIDEIWTQARDITSGSLEDLERTAMSSLQEAERLLAIWGPRKENFATLSEFFQQGEYEEFETQLSGCIHEITQLPEVKEWHSTCKSRTAQIRHSINLAQEEIGRQNWNEASDYLKRARAIPSSGSLRRAIRELDVQIWEALWPRRLVWAVGICALLGEISYLIGILKWFLAALLVALGYSLVIMILCVRDARKSGAPWRQIVREVLLFCVGRFPGANSSRRV